ncbi:MAG: cupin domain-containing protein [Pelagimonas sp.]|jgi:transcriptional regulator with XRE-family HTH domain|nr:cupin domain-containing protein [Pelagimonas sp.]
MRKSTSPHDQLVARRLRVVRQAKGLSQRELARRTGVGSGTISQIESGATQPSVAVLKKILDGVPMDLASFFSFELASDDMVVFRKADQVDIGAPGVQYRMVSAKNPDHKIQMIHERYEPGKDSGRRMISHEGEECGVVLSGVLEITLEDEVFLLEPGDAYYFQSTRPHRFRNPGSEPCEVVSACTPPSF